LRYVMPATAQAVGPRYPRRRHLPRSDVREVPEPNSSDRLDSQMVHTRQPPQPRVSLTAERHLLRSGQISDRRRRHAE
jgi:hypothetical protein